MEDNEMYEVDTIIIADEDGTETELAVLDKFIFEEKNYVVLSEVINEEISDDEQLYYYEEIDGEMYISSIDEDAEFERAAQYYDSLFED